MLPTDPEINQFQPFGYRVIEDIFRFDVSVADCVLVQIVDGLQQLVSDLP